MGRSNEDPLPPILNNKFDALPPAEGLVYDFVFDFKARGQWKHWNDLVKNMDNPEVLTPLTIIPTIDTGIFFCETIFFAFNILFLVQRIHKVCFGGFHKTFDQKIHANFKLEILFWTLY